MNADDRGLSPGVDEASWIYLSSVSVEERADPNLEAELVEACERSGWRAVSHPSPSQMKGPVDAGRFYSSVSHAVQHADVVVAVIGAYGEMTDAELTLACSHGRPVVGVRIGEGPVESQVETLLRGYERARIVSCQTPGECAHSLQETLTDPAFVATIRQAW